MNSNFVKLASKLFLFLLQNLNVFVFKPLYDLMEQFDLSKQLLLHERFHYLIQLLLVNNLFVVYAIGYIPKKGDGGDLTVKEHLLIDQLNQYVPRFKLFVFTLSLIEATLMFLIIDHIKHSISE